MKKLTAMLLALTLCFGLAACGGNTAQDDTKDESQTSSAFAPLANTATRTCLPVPWGRTIAPRTCWSA